jgi:hypothetical protein
MKMIKQLVLLFFIALVLNIVACTESTNKSKTKLPVVAIAVPVKNGWGYEIYVDNKIYIKQNYIPAINGIHQFANKEHALTTANLVLAKMKEGKKPFLTIDDLKKAGIDITK